MKNLNIVTKQIDGFNEVLHITNQRVIYWRKQKSLILSDLHIGKSAHFQKSGIPIPSSILNKDLERLKQLILYFKVEKLIIVGDLFHAEYNQDLSDFKDVRSLYKQSSNSPSSFISSIISRSLLF